jgi:integrase
LNFDAGKITIHDGKGKKDRTVPLAKALLPELKSQLHTVRRIMTFAPSRRCLVTAI